MYKRQIIVATRGGYSVRFALSDVTPRSRTAGGVRAVRLTDGDVVAGATIVDDTRKLLTLSLIHILGRYHPHGDAAVYDALVRMAQTFSMRYPLIDGQGNFGTVDGDAAAAYRYTEARLSRIASEMMSDIKNCLLYTS